MQRREEGYEPEREVTPQGAERPRPGGLRPVELATSRREPYIAEEPAVTMRARDLLRWSSIWAGFFLSLSLIVLLGALGAGLGLSVAGGPAAVGGASTATGVGAALWGAFMLAVAFFFGGWLAGRTSAIAGPMVGLFQGLVVWALTTAALLAFGATGLAGALGAILGAGAPSAPAGGTVGALTIATGAAWGAFAALLIGLIFAALGGWVGGQDLPEHIPGQ